MIKLLLLGWVLTTTLACVWIIKYFIKESKDSKNKQRAEKWFYGLITKRKQNLKNKDE